MGVIKLIKEHDKTNRAAEESVRQLKVEREHGVITSVHVDERKPDTAIVIENIVRPTANDPFAQRTSFEVVPTSEVGNILWEKVPRNIIDLASLPTPQKGAVDLLPKNDVKNWQLLMPDYLQPIVEESAGFDPLTFDKKVLSQIEIAPDNPHLDNLAKEAGCAKKALIDIKKQIRSLQSYIEKFVNGAMKPSDLNYQKVVGTEDDIQLTSNLYNMYKDDLIIGHNIAQYMELVLVYNDYKSHFENNLQEIVVEDFETVGYQQIAPNVKPEDVVEDSVSLIKGVRT
jgi:hypothetical protein